MVTPILIHKTWGAVKQTCRILAAEMLFLWYVKVSSRNDQIISDTIR